MSTAGATTTVASGATIDLAGFNAEITDLEGAGTVTDSGAADMLALEGGDFHAERLPARCRSKPPAL